MGEVDMRIDDTPVHSRRARRGLSRRELLRMAAAGGAAAAGLGSLSGRLDRAWAAAPVGKRGGVWRMAIPGNPTAYPITIPGKLVDILVDKTIFSTLVKYELRNGAIQVVPDLALSWSANATLTEYTFRLRPGVKWHDGQPFGAGDVKFTMDTVLNPKVNAGMAGVVSAIARTTVVDPSTVKFTLKYPYASLPVILGYNIAIVPKHLLEAQDPNQPVQFIRNPVGTGPFKFKSFTQDSYLEVSANPEYYLGPPMLDGIEFKVIPDGNTRLAQLRSGDIDFTVIDPPQVAAVQGARGIEVRRAPQVDYYFFAINHDLPKFADVRVRQALTYAIDKQAIVKSILKGDGRPATGPINPLLGAFYNPNVETYVQPGEGAGAARRGGVEKGRRRGPREREGRKVHAALQRPEGVPGDGAGHDVRPAAVPEARVRRHARYRGMARPSPEVPRPQVRPIDGMVDHAAGPGSVRPLLQRLAGQLVGLQERGARPDPHQGPQRAGPAEARDAVP